MLSEGEWGRVAAALPFLADRGSDVARAVVAEAMLMRLPAGATVFEEGDACSIFAVLLDGRVRVFKIGETGREITLYRFERGESCILTASCILNERQFPAIAAVERDSEALVVPHQTFQRWVDQHPAWRGFVFDLLARRLGAVMAVLDEVAFRRMDARIAELLLRQSAPGRPALALTHQQIAAELGSSREVVSRILADWADDGLLQLGRGVITLLDRAGLARRAGLAV